MEIEKIEFNKSSTLREIIKYFKYYCFFINLISILNIS